MGKYNYDKKVLKGLSVVPFLNEVKTRNKHIEEADATLHNFDYNANNIADSLHPHKQFVVVKSIIKDNYGKTFCFVPNIKKGTKSLANFRAGQYICIQLDINGVTINKPYSLFNGPLFVKGNDDNFYLITVREKENGFASKYLLNNVKIGDEFVISAPLGNFYYEPLRDSKNVIAVAGGVGITPFISMGRAIITKEEDFNLTILYGNRDEKSIMCINELNKLEKLSKGKIKIINVFSDAKVEGAESGFITADLIKKYAPKDSDYSVFVCGPQGLYDFCFKELNKLKLPPKRIRYELYGEFGSPLKDKLYDKKLIDKVFKLKVIVRGEEFETTCNAKESIMFAIEKAGIRIPSSCRSGTCGWCHSRLIKGNVFVPSLVDGRRAADKTYSWIHPCVSYPLSDIEIEVFPLLIEK